MVYVHPPVRDVRIDQSPLYGRPTSQPKRLQSGFYLKAICSIVERVVALTAQLSADAPVCATQGSRLTNIPVKQLVVNPLPQLAEQTDPAALVA